MSRVRIACCGPAGKWERMGWQSFIDYAHSHNVEVFYLDLTRPIAEQSPISLIIHKLTFIMTGDNLATDPQLRALSEFAHAHPEIPVIDDLESVEVTLDRKKMDDILKQIEWPSDLPVRVPRSRMLLDAKQDFPVGELTFPVLVKPKTASSTTEAHLMRLVSLPEQLRGVATPALLQEFVNHNGAVFKVYALAEHLEAGVRPSIRNIEPGEEIALDFHSQHSEVDNGIWTRPADLAKVEIPREKFKRVSEILRRNLKLNLIGFDILIDQEQRFWLVDLNYFPGYKNIDDLWGKFFRLFLNMIKQNPEC